MTRGSRLVVHFASRRWVFAASCALTTLLAAEAEAQGFDDGDVDVAVGGQVFSGWVYEDAEDDDFNEFVLDRGEVGVHLVWRESFGGEIRGEAVRSAGPDSLVGIDGDSLIFRAKRAFAFGHVRPIPHLEVVAHAGLVPDAWVATVEPGYPFLAVRRTAAETAFFFDTSDLGATLQLVLADGLGRLAVSATNGEGRRLGEQNKGKNTTVLIETVPLTFPLLGEPTRVAAAGGYRDGSLGPASGRNHRFFATASLSSRRLSIGAEYVRGLGYLERPELEAETVAAWAGGHLSFPWVGAVVRYDRVVPDVDAGDARHIITGGLYSDLVEPGLARVGDPTRFRVYALVADERADAGAAPIPGAPGITDRLRIMLLVEVSGDSLTLE